MIDWFTVIAQMINFLILLALLKYFLYNRIINAMAHREQELIHRAEEAQREQQEASAALHEARLTNERLEEQREELLIRARDEVEEHRKQLLSKVRAEAEQARSRWAESIDEESESFLRDLRRRASEEICAIAGQALSDLADVSLERHMVSRFLNKIRELGDAERQTVLATLGAEPKLLVQTAHELPDDLRTRVAAALREKLAMPVAVEFEEAPDLICGIAVHSNAHKLAWDLRDYLAALEQELQRTLDEETAARRPRGAAAVEAEP